MHSMTLAERRAPEEPIASLRADADRINNILDTMRPGSILSSLPEADLRNLLRHSSARTLPRQRVLFRCGDAGHSVVLVLKGFVKLSTSAANGREVVLEIAGPGTIFGEIAVLNGSPRRADAICVSACKVLAIDGRMFRQALASNPEAMFATMRLLCERLSAVTTRGLDAISLPAPVRLAKALLHLADLDSQLVNGSTQIGFRLSQRELGAMTGLIRESINKHLSAWRSAGWVELSGGSVTRCDVSALRRFVRDYETP